MATVRCDCGETLTLPQGFAGHLHCPRCGRGIVTSPPPAYPQGYAPPAYPPLPLYRPSLTPKGAGIACGILMLLTSLMPWAIEKQSAPSFAYSSSASRDNVQVIMAWNVLDQAPDPIKTLFIGLWIIGLLAIVLGGALRGLALAIAYIALSATGITLLVIAMDLLRGLSYGFALQNFNALAIVGVVAFVGTLITSTVRGRMGPSVGWGICQTIFGAALLGLQVVSFVRNADGISMALRGEYGTGPEANFMRVSMVLGLVFQILIAISGLLAFIHGLAMNSTGTGPSRAARGLLYTALIGICVVVGAFPVFFETRNGVNLMPLHMLILLFPLLVFAIEGLAGVPCAILASWRGGGAGFPVGGWQPGRPR